MKNFFVARFLHAGLIRETLADNLRKIQDLGLGQNIWNFLKLPASMVSLIGLVDQYFVALP